MFCENYDEFVSVLTKHDYTVHSAKNGTEAKEIALKLIGSDSCGFGGSMTVASIGLYEALLENGNPVFKSSYGISVEERNKIYKDAADAKWYVSSTNAITKEGALVNIDGTANRVASMVFGPDKVIIFVGKNKLTEDISSAITRVKEVATPPNARRLNKKTPCAVTGKCVNCSSPDRLCKVTTIIEYKPNYLEEMHLILIDEELGF